MSSCRRTLKIFVQCLKIKLQTGPTNQQPIYRNDKKQWKKKKKQKRKWKNIRGKALLMRDIADCIVRSNKARKQWGLLHVKVNGSIKGGM